MTSPINIEAIAVYVQIDGKVCLAPIAEESAHMFVQMLPAFQPGLPEKTKLIQMPDAVASLVNAAGVALGASIDEARFNRAAQGVATKSIDQYV